MSNESDSIERERRALRKRKRSATVSKDGQAAKRSTKKGSTKKAAATKSTAKKATVKKGIAKNASKKAVKKSGPKEGEKPKERERERGPRGWLFPIVESAYTKLVPRDQPEPRPAPSRGRAFSIAGGSPGARGFRSAFQPGRGEEVLADVGQDLWVDRLAEYKRRKAGEARAVRRRRLGAAPLPPGAIVPGARNWAPLGPSVVMEGQARGLPAVAGRVSGIAIAPGGMLIFAATANGGVFRSDDGGISWRSLMDGFDLDPTNFASTSLASGAIAIDARDPRRIYVGTGEGDTHALFGNRITNALPAYRGIGPIRSDDGGATWVSEDTAAASPGLGGKAFFALAVDPANREHVIGATTEGLYQRVITAGGKPEWIRRRTGVHSSVVATFSAGATRFYAAEWGRGVVQSSNGTSWSALGTGFPTTGVGRIALGVQPNNPRIVYAFVANTRGALLGVFRLDRTNNVWKRVANPPDVLPAEGGGSQGDYDLAIAVDPADTNIIYLGGSYFADGEFWPASVWRCRVQSSGTGFRMTGTSIGANAHADVHVLVHSPGDPNALWCGCDGGIFLNRAPRANGIFASRNNGLSCLCPNYFAQHPTDPNILFCGLQDNGTARTSGGPIWKHVNWGDGGYCHINWANPRQVLVFANGSVYRAIDGGVSHNSWSVHEFDWAMMTEPIVGPPYDPAHPNDAKLVALGAGAEVILSRDFGASWPTRVAIPTSGGIFSMTFASATRFYVGTTRGEVFRVDRSGSSWSVTRIDNAPAGPLALRGLIADIGIDWSDPSRDSVYIAFGGTGDYRHVWRYDGTQWEARSGPAGAARNLLDVEHNAITVDHEAPNNIYVGADIGVWHSADGGASWIPLPHGLPDAPVFDLQIHPTRRLLRAATHGRGLYEYELDPVA